MAAIKVMKTMKAKQVLGSRRGQFAGRVADSIRKAKTGVVATESKNQKKNKLANVRDQKALVSERIALVKTMRLADLDKLHKNYELGTKPVKEVLSITKEELDSLQLSDLKKRCAKKDLKVGGSKGEIVQRLLDHASEGLKASLIQAVLDFEAARRKEELVREAKAREAAAAREAKVRAVLSQLKKEIASKTGEELKQLLIGYDLKQGGSKDEKVARIVERQRADGKVETILASMARDERRKELLAMSAADLRSICDKTKDIFDDRLVREIIVDRLVASGV
jgi:hypothetical protein